MLVVYAQTFFVGHLFWNLQFGREQMAAILTSELPRDEASACVWFVPGTWEDGE